MWPVIAPEVMHSGHVLPLDAPENTCWARQGSEWPRLLHTCEAELTAGLSAVVTAAIIL